MTHAQQAYKNATVYLEVKEGRTATAQKAILETMEGFLHTNPEQLLEEHRGCRGEYEMAETSQMVVTASVHPRRPISLIQDGADGVSPAQGSGLCSTLVDKKDEHVCSLQVQNSLS
jgi:hypothetical protein